MHVVRLALLFGLCLLAGCFERAKPATENAVRPVQAVRTDVVPSAENRSYAGVVRPRREADVGFRAGGRITERLVDMGARVVAGQELARLDPNDLGLAVRSAEADLTAAMAQNAQAQADAERSRKLKAAGWVSAAEDDGKQALARAAAEKVTAARAALDLTRNRLDYAVLRAPTDGIVTAVLADRGTVVAEGTPVLRIAEAGALEVEVALPELLASTATQEASVTIWARPDATLRARLRELSPAANPQLRTYAARYALPDPPAWLAIGMTATVRLVGEQTEMLTPLPASALIDRGQGASVWVIDAAAGRIEARPVKVRALRQDRALVEGLKAGELVVALGVQKLDPASRVRVTDIRPMMN